jgi:hypothetical protein
MEHETLERERNCKLDYEQMYYELSKKYEWLNSEYERVNENCARAMARAEFLQAQLDIVYLIFGGKTRD